MQLRNLFYLRFFSVLALITFASCYVYPQTTSAPQGTRDAAAVSTVQAAIVAEGGQAMIATIQDATVTGTCDETTKNGTIQLSIDWVNDGDEFSYSSSGARGQSTFVSGHGNPEKMIDGKTSSWSQVSAAAVQPVHLPAIALFRYQQDSSFSFVEHGLTKTDLGTLHEVEIKTTVPFGFLSPVDEIWYFDPATNLPARVSYYLPTEAGLAVQAPVSYDFLNFGMENGILSPQRFVINAGSGRSITCIISGIQFNTHPDPTMFDLANGGAQ